MAVPAPVITVVPNTITRTNADLNPSVVLTDTATHNPVATARTFKAGAVTVGTTTGNGAGANTVTIQPDLAEGVHSMTVNTVNSEGNATSAGVNLTIVDSIDSTDYVAGEYPGVQRLKPSALPPEFKDGRNQAAGMPSAQRVKAIRDAKTSQN